MSFQLKLHSSAPRPSFHPVSSHGFSPCNFPGVFNSITGNNYNAVFNYHSWVSFGVASDFSVETFPVFNKVQVAARAKIPSRAPAACVREGRESHAVFGREIVYTFKGGVVRYWGFYQFTRTSPTLEGASHFQERCLFLEELLIHEAAVC